MAGIFCTPAVRPCRSVGARLSSAMSKPASKCCAAPPAKTGVSELMGAVNLGDVEDVKSSVQKYYGEVLSTSDDLKTSACKTAVAPNDIVKSALRKVPDEVKAKYYGCGSPFPMGITGLRVLDLGSGSGRDCYVCSELVGESGYVTGIDMTRAQLDVAEKYVDEHTATLGYSEPNMKFLEGTIEDIRGAGIEDGSVDLIISNCVINLSGDKAAVLQGMWDSLDAGGEAYFSDVYCDRRLPESIRTHPELLGECLGGALYVNDFVRLCRGVGFQDPRVMATNVLEVEDAALKDLVGEANFFSITYRLFKLPDAETLCEDYGQVATYKGTIEGLPHAYVLDDHHKLETGRPMLVCGNTASMLQDTWLKAHFEVQGDRSVHYGEFDCSGVPSAIPTPQPTAPSSGGGGCC